MKIQEQPEKKELENLLPLVNVVFLLLIFFMVAGAFSSPELFSINPTIAKNNTQANREVLTILVNQYGELAINQEEVSLKSLNKIINNHLIDNPKQKIQLKPDAETEAIRVVDILETLGETNLEAVHIMTSTSK
ncbi:MAG: biopolymer transporter ExbD [Gammaproteobacteria bacterium]|nr:biopolymer transporter ExbD [Gammaproteobacteria bacterium]